MYEKHILIGNLGQPPEMRYTPNGKPVCNLSLAVNRKWNDGQGGTHEEVTWYRVTAWDKLAELAAEYCFKGQLVMVEGDRIKVTTYTNLEGKPAASIELTANVIRFLSKKEGSPAGARDTGETLPNEDPYTGDGIPF